MKPRLKLLSNGGIRLIKAGTLVRKEEEVERDLKANFKNKAQFSRFSGFTQSHVMAATAQYGERTAGRVAELRQILSLLSNPSLASMAKVASLKKQQQFELIKAELIDRIELATHCASFSSCATDATLDTIEPTSVEDERGWINFAKAILAKPPLTAEEITAATVMRLTLTPVAKIASAFKTSIATILVLTSECVISSKTVFNPVYIAQDYARRQIAGTPAPLEGQSVSAAVAAGTLMEMTTA